MPPTSKMGQLSTDSVTQNKTVIWIMARFRGFFRRIKGSSEGSSDQEFRGSILYDVNEIS